MAVTLPTGWQDLLESEAFRYVIVCELALDGGTQYYGFGEVTWGGNTYSPLITEISDIIWDKDFDVPREATLTFDNVALTLRDDLTADLLTEKRATVRLLIGPPGGALLADDYVLVWGNMQQPERIDKHSLQVKIVAATHGANVTIPGYRHLGRACEHKFANAGAYDGSGDCPYQNTTTASGAGADSTALIVASGVNLVDGREITIGSGAAVEIASGGGTVNITLAEARTWSNGDPVRYVDCNHEIVDCEKRVQTHRYSGVRGYDDIASLRVAQRQPVTITNLRTVQYLIQHPFPQVSIALPADVPEAQPLFDNSAVQPVLFGRRLVSGILVELHGFRWSFLPNQAIQVRNYALALGEIESIVDFYTADGKGVSNPPKIHFYYRVGTSGVEDEETEAEYFADIPTSKRATQNRDLFSATGDTLHGLAWSAFLQWQPGENAPELVEPQFDTKGFLLQKYTNAATPTTDGSPVWLRNPIWQAVACLIEAWGYAQAGVLDTDLDFTVIQPESLECDGTVYGNYNDVVDTTDDAESGQYDVWEVDDTFQYTRGMPVEVDENGATTDATVVNVWSDTRVRLSYAKQNPTAPAKIRPKLSRYTNDLYLDTEQRGSETLAQILRACSGYVTYDVDGKIQLRVERAAGAAVAHFKDYGADQGYSIRDGFELRQASVADELGAGLVNQVILRYRTQENIERAADPSNWTHRNTHVLKRKSLDVPGVDNYILAYRLAKLELDRHQVLGNGAVVPVGPIALMLQPGLDTVQITHNEPDWTGQTLLVERVRIKGTQAGNDHLNIDLTLGDYDSSLYTDDPPPEVTMSRANEDTEPSITLSVTVSAPTIQLSWTYGTGMTPPTVQRLWKHTATMGGDPAGTGELVAENLVNPYYEYQPTDDEFLGGTLYFVVTAKVGPYQNQVRIQSNEVTAVPIRRDPTETEDEQGVNTVYDGGFRIAHQWEDLPEPTFTEVNPDASTGDYTNPANAYDGSLTTYTLGEISGGGTKTETYTLPGSGSVTGYWRVQRHSCSGQASQKFYYSNDGGGSFVQFAASPSSGTVNSNSPVHTGNRDPGGSELQIKCETVAGSTRDARGLVAEIDWMESASTAAGGAIVSDGECLLWGDSGGATYGEIRRPWPGVAGGANKTIANGSNWVVQLKYTRGGAAPSNGIEIFLYELDTDTYRTLHTIVAANIVADKYEEAMLWTAAATYSGPFLVGVRFLGPWADRVRVRDLMFTEGQMIHRFTPHVDEPQKDPDNTWGVADGFPSGPWDGTAKRSIVST